MISLCTKYYTCAVPPIIVQFSRAVRALGGVGHKATFMTADSEVEEISLQNSEVDHANVIPCAVLNSSIIMAICRYVYNCPVKSFHF